MKVMIADIYNACGMKEIALENAERALPLARACGGAAAIETAESTIDRLKDLGLQQLLRNCARP